jgi:hypothetical protein
MNSHVLVLGALWLASTQGFGATCQDKAGKTVPIRLADKAEYSTIQEWENPRLLVSRVEGFSFMVRPSKVWGPSIAFDATLVTLDEQSCDAWPLGAVVELQSAGGLSPAFDEAEAEKRMLRLKDALERKGIVVILLPSA